MDKEQIKQREQEILDLIKQFCDQKLNEEYFEISEKLLHKLGRKKDVPFKTGNTKTWAAGVIHAVGTINFLFDKSFEPYVSVNDIAYFFDVATSTTLGKSKQMRDMLKIGNWDNEFSTKNTLDSNPFANMVTVDGMIVPISSLPEPYKTMALEAKAEGKQLSFKTKK